MAQIVKLRRSSVSGQKPTNSNLQLGELALNTTDGKVYMAKSGSLGPTVEELISTNTVNTGSVNISGSLNLIGNQTITGSLYLVSSSLPEIRLQNVDYNQNYHITVGNAGYLNVHDGQGNYVALFGTSSANFINNIYVSNSLHAVNNVTASYFSGSFIGNATGLTNVPFRVSGSDVNGNQSDKTFTKLHFDSDTGLNVSESAPGTAFISIGSHFKDIFVSGSPILSATGSDAFEIIPTGGIEISTSITDTNGNGYVKELNISTTTLSSSLNNRINVITGSLNSFTSSINTFTSSVVLTSQTSSMNVLSASYALTAAFALNAGAGGGGGASIGSYNSLVVTSSASTWSFSHNTGQRYPIFQVFDNSGYVVIPSQIQTIDDNNANIIFSSPQTGRVIASLGGGNGLTEAFTSSSLWIVDHNLGTDYPDVTIWDSNRNIVFPNRIESVNANQIKIYFSQAISGNVSVSRGGHIVNGSVSGTIGLSDITWANLLNKPSGLVSGSSQLTGSYDTRYVLSGSITQTTWDNIANKPSGLISGSVQVELTGTTGYSTFSSSVSTSIGSLSSSVATTTSGLTSTITSLSSSITSSIGSLSSSVATTTSGLSSSIGSLSSSVATTTNELTSTITSLSSSLSSSIDYLSSSVATTNNNLSSSISSSIGSLSSSVASINNTQNGRLDSLETASGSIRTDFNSFTSSYTTVSGSLDSRLDVLEAYSGSQLVPSSSMSFRTLQTDVYCKNMSGTQINKGTVVRIVGSVGDNPLIGVASLLTEGQSANTLGIATENIPNDGFGLVITEGVLTGVNTSGMTAGQLIFLGENGTFTTSYPVPPNHGVRLGEVLRVQQNQGSIYVRIDNGAELGESHDVYDTTTNSSYGDLLVKSGSVWVNSRSLNGNYAVTGSLTITQNLTVLGSSSITYVTSSQLQVATSTISVNVFEPAERFGGLKVYDSGSSSATASLLWDSQNNHWVYQNASGSNYSGGMLLSGPRNTGSLGDEIGLISGRIAKSVGGDHLDNSIISETGTTITIAGDLVANSITGAFDFYGLVNRPTLVSGSSQISYSGLTGIPSGIVSGSSQISYTGITNIPSGIVSGSSQISYSGLTGIPSGIVSGSVQVDVMSTTNIARLATTGSNTFTSNQIITGSISTTGNISINSTSTSQLNVYTSSVSTQNIMSEFYNGDYTTNTRNFIRVRNGINAGSTMSSYFGQGQDGKTYIIANDFTKNHIVIDGNSTYVGINKNTPNSQLDVNGNTTVTGSLVTTSNVTIGTSYSISQLNVGGQSSQTTAALTDSGTRNGLIEVLAAGGAAGNGGGIVFGSNTQGNDTGRGQVAIKASLINGAGMGTSDLVFSIRAQTSDTNLTERLKLTPSGVLQPSANGTQDLGSSSNRWGTVYTSDLSMSNGIGDYTIVEGLEDLFLYNNKTNKVFKFMLQEVDPSTATPKKS